MHIDSSIKHLLSIFLNFSFYSLIYILWYITILIHSRLPGLNELFIPKILDLKCVGIMFHAFCLCRRRLSKSYPISALRNFTIYNSRNNYVYGTHTVLKRIIDYHYWIKKSHFLWTETLTFTLHFPQVPLILH